MGGEGNRGAVVLLVHSAKRRKEQKEAIIYEIRDEVVELGAGAGKEKCGLNLDKNYILFSCTQFAKDRDG